MIEAMTQERFQDLADAYGGTIARWPEAERSAATRLAANPAARAVLEQASGFDAALDGWVIPKTSPTLALRIAATAPKPGLSLTGRAPLWWSGLGLAATLAGAAAGSMAAAASLPAPMVMEGATAFGNLDRSDPS